MLTHGQTPKTTQQQIVSGSDLSRPNVTKIFFLKNIMEDIH